MSERAYWYIFKLAQGGKAITVISGPYARRVDAYPTLDRFRSLDRGALFLIDSIHYDRAKVQGDLCKQHAPKESKEPDLEKWARRYDSLNGAPEDWEDR